MESANSNTIKRAPAKTSHSHLHIFFKQTLAQIKLQVFVNVCMFMSRARGLLETIKRQYVIGHILIKPIWLLQSTIEQ